MHVGIIMHGNAQWAMQRGLPSAASCAAGVAALRTTVSLAAYVRVRTLTLYAIGSPGGARPPPEVDADLCVLQRFLQDNLQCGPEDSPRISLIGNRGAPGPLLPSLRAHNEHVNVAGTRLHLRIVVDYSAHDSLIRQAWCNPDPCAPEQFIRQLRELDPTALTAGAVDLLVRTGGGWCRSDFMLWEVAYANLYFVDRLWPDFTARDFQQALGFHTRQNELISVD
jgi:undecaprenyl diphosphate synthase